MMVIIMNIIVDKGESGKKVDHLHGEEIIRGQKRPLERG